MLGILICILLASLALISASLRPVYGFKPIKELKRRSAKGDPVAHALYQVTRHGVTGDTFLLLVSLVTSAILFVILARSLSGLVAALLLIILMSLVLVILPKSPTKQGRALAFKLGPYLAQILIKIRPVTNFIAQQIRRNRPITFHTGLYDKEDLVELIASQKVVANNRIEATELDLAMSSLTFGEKLVGEYMIPRRTVHFVHAEEPVGPVLLAELHDSGFSRFPVRTDDDNKIVGTLYVKDLATKRVSGIVSNVMSPDVFYVRDDASLERVLAGFIKTKHHLFMVVNEFEEVVGVITIEDVLEQVLGRKIIDEFDNYDDLRAVARKEAKQDHHQDTIEATDE